MDQNWNDLDSTRAIQSLGSQPEEAAEAGDPRTEQPIPPAEAAPRRRRRADRYAEEENEETIREAGEQPEGRPAGVQPFSRGGAVPSATAREAANRFGLRSAEPEDRYADPASFRTAGAGPASRPRPVPGNRMPPAAPPYAGMQTAEERRRGRLSADPRSRMQPPMPEAGRFASGSRRPDSGMAGTRRPETRWEEPEEDRRGHRGILITAVAVLLGIGVLVTGLLLIPEDADGFPGDVKRTVLRWMGKEPARGVISFTAGDYENVTAPVDVSILAETSGEITDVRLKDGNGNDLPLLMKTKVQTNGTNTWNLVLRVESMFRETVKLETLVGDQWTDTGKTLTFAIDGMPGDLFDGSAYEGESVYASELHPDPVNETEGAPQEMPDPEEDPEEHPAENPEGNPEEKPGANPEGAGDAAQAELSPSAGPEDSGAAEDVIAIAPLEAGDAEPAADSLPSESDPFQEEDPLAGEDLFDGEEPQPEDNPSLNGDPSDGEESSPEIEPLPADDSADGEEPLPADEPAPEAETLPEDSPSAEGEPQPEGESPAEQEPAEKPALTVKACEEADPSQLIRETVVWNGQKKASDYNRPEREWLHMPSGEQYTASRMGVLTFRGDAFRQNAFTGVIKSASKLKVEWKAESGSIKGKDQTYYGTGWVGQPAIVKWSKEVREKTDIYENQRGQTALKEVIVAGQDGSIRFLDLLDGKPTRNSIKVGYPMRGAPSVHPMGFPYMNVGQYARKMASGSGRIGLHQFNLYNSKAMTLIDGLDGKLRRYSNDVGSFETSSLIDRTSDTMVTAGTNGLLYVISLASTFDYNLGTYVQTPNQVIVRMKAKGEADKDTAVEASVAMYDRYVFYADMGGILRCVDTNTMRAVWAVQTGDSVESTPALELVDGETGLRLYTANELNKRKSGKAEIRCYDALSGRELWMTGIGVEKPKKQKYTVGFRASPVVGQHSLDGLIWYTVNGLSADGAAALGLPEDADGALIALNKADGKIVWARGVPGNAYSSPVAVYDADGNGWIIQCGGDGTVMLLEGLTGKTVDEIKLEAVVEASPAVYNDTLVIGTTQRGANFIYGIKIQ